MSSTLKMVQKQICDIKTIKSVPVDFKFFFKSTLESQ